MSLSRLTRPILALAAGAAIAVGYAGLASAADPQKGGAEF